MKFITSASLLFLLGVASALPTDLENTALEVRADPSNSPIDLKLGPESDTKYKCGKEEYTGHEIYLAAQRGVNLQKISEQRGKAKYPHSYPFNESKRVKLEFPPECPPRMGENRQEFPLVHDGPYDGGPNNDKTGEERVVYYWDRSQVAPDGNPIVYYCGMITHTGAVTGGFLKC